MSGEEACSCINVIPDHNVGLKLGGKDIFQETRFKIFTYQIVLDRRQVIKNRFNLDIYNGLGHHGDYLLLESIEV